jgi:hypothetical protein
MACPQWPGELTALRREDGQLRQSATPWRVAAWFAWGTGTSRLPEGRDRALAPVESRLLCSEPSQERFHERIVLLQWLVLEADECLGATRMAVTRRARWRVR